MKTTHLLGFLLGAIIEAIITPKRKPPSVGYLFSYHAVALYAPKKIATIHHLGDPPGGLI